MSKPLFKRDHYRASVLVQGTRHKLTMTHPSQSPIGQWEAKCLDYNGSGFKAHAKAKTKGEADRLLRVALGLETARPVPVATPAIPAPDIEGLVMHVPESAWYGRPTPARSFIFGLAEICEALKDDRARSMPDCPGTVKFHESQPGVKGKSRAKAAKWEISPEVLPEFWELVNAFHVGKTLKIVDMTQGSGDPLLIKVGG